MIQFVNPIWLWGLTGLLVPIGIHLLSRKESRVIKIGSIRHLDATRTKQSVNLRLNEILLLAIRCFLIMLLVLHLSGLNFDVGNSKRDRWLLMERGVETDPQLTQLRDSLIQRGYKARYLEKGFPDVESEGEQASLPSDYWTLAEDLTSVPLEHVVVLSYNYAERFRGKRAALPSNVTWISTEPSRLEFALDAVKISRDSVSVRNGNSSMHQTTFNTENYPVGDNQRYFRLTQAGDSTLVRNRDTLTVTVVSDADFEYDKKIIVASLQALEEVVPYIFKIDDIQPDDWSTDRKTDWLIWLSPNKFSADPGQKCISFIASDGKNNPVLTPSNINGKDNWNISKRLNEQVALKENLALQLATILISNEALEQKANALDRRSHPEKLTWSHEDKVLPQKTAVIQSDVSGKFLAMLILIVLVTERLIAFKRNQ